MLTRKIGNILKILYFIHLDIFINIYIYIYTRYEYGYINVLYIQII